jgi:hypothetical protein
MREILPQEPGKLASVRGILVKELGILPVFYAGNDKY